MTIFPYNQKIIYKVHFYLIIKVLFKISATSSVFSICTPAPPKFIRGKISTLYLSPMTKVSFGVIEKSFSKAE